MQHKPTLSSKLRIWFGGLGSAGAAVLLKLGLTPNMVTIKVSSFWHASCF